MFDFAKKTLVLLLIIVSTSLSAQENEKYFDSEPEAFMSQLKGLFKLSAREELDELYNKLEKDYKSGKISESQQNKMVDILNLMYSKNMQVYPYFKNLIEASTFAHNSNYDETFLDKWYTYLKTITKNAKKGQHKDFNIFIDFSKDFFSNNCLVMEKSKSYKIETNEVNFTYVDGKNYVRVGKTDLKGFFKFDTMAILNTSGVYCINDKTWKGKGGSISWSRVGLPEASCTFGNYDIDMNKSDFSIDTVTLVYKEFFPLPIKGKLINRITKEFDSLTVDYPQFYSYDKNFDYKNKVASNVNCKGGFLLKGKKVFVGSQNNEYVTVEIFSNDGKTKIFSALGTSAIFEKNKFIMMNEARINIFAKNDSISHPFCQFKYDVEKKELRVVHEDFGSGRSRFRSSFHKMSFDAEMLIWHIDNDEIDIKNLVGKGKNATKFVSDHNFDKNTYNLARTAASTNDPLSLISKYENSDEISLESFAKTLSPQLTTTAVLPTVFMLEQEGFLKYNPEKKSFIPNSDYAKFYVLANAKKKDYDLLRFKGFGDKFVAKYNIKTNKLDAFNVNKIPFNDSSNVMAFPTDTSKVSIYDNRYLEFDAKMFVGRMDLYGKGYKFKYDSFEILSDNIQKMKINIPDKIDTVTGEDISLKVLTSDIDSFKGKIFINAKFNKSGMQSAKKYPRLVTSSNSYVYYNHPNIFNGIYNKEKFYFQISPFSKDSLQSFDPNLLEFSGKLFSADIFNVFEERVKIQKDLSLGFLSTTTNEGLKSYKGKGKFVGNVSLSNNGLIGIGTQTHQSLEISSDSINYFPERMSTLAKKLEMSEQTVGVQFPLMISDSSVVDWMPYSDTMLLVNKKSKPFVMYNDNTLMNGLLVLTDKGLFGKGYLDFPEAKISSKHMVFKAKNMLADTSSMEIKNIGDKVTFKAPNVKTNMDFIKKIGEFKSNEKDISTVFAENKYKAEINEFVWDMTKKILTFNSPPDSKGSLFTSIHPDQDSLNFYAKKAEYNMLSSVIKLDGVEEIKIADSRVIPNNGKVTLFPDAKMETLIDANIEGDTTNMWHVFSKCKLDIHGKTDLIGYGSYSLEVNNTKHDIKLNSIKTTKNLVSYDKKKGQIFSHTIEGKGKVDKSQNLQIYKNTDFYGDVSIFMNKKFPHFIGKQRIKFNQPQYTTPWFDVDNEINVEEFSLVRDKILADDNKQLYTAFMVDRSETPKGLYTNLLKFKNNEQDQVAMDFAGVIKHDQSIGQYVFGDSSRIFAQNNVGNVINYNDSNGIVKSKGKFNPQLNLGGIPIELGGEIDNNLLENTYNFRVSAGLNMTLDSRFLNVLGNFIVSEFGENKDIVVDNVKFKDQLAQLLHSKDFQRLENEIANSGAILNPNKYTPSNIVLSNLDMTWDPIDLCYRSQKEFGVVQMGNTVVNKMINGFFEMGYGEYHDFFNLYLKAKNREWIYITYSDGILGLVSSNDNFNGQLSALDPKKRYVKKTDNIYYKYSLAEQFEADNFYKRMKNGGKFSDDEKKEAFEFEKPDIDKSDLNNAVPFEESTPDLDKANLENARQDSILKEFEKKLALEEQNEISAKEEKLNKRKQKMLKDLEKAKESEINNEENNEELFERKEKKESTKVDEYVEPTKTENTEEDPDSKYREGQKKDQEPEKQEEPKSLFDKYF